MYKYLLFLITIFASDHVSAMEPSPKRAKTAAAIAAKKRNWPRLCLEHGKKHLTTKPAKAYEYLLWVSKQKKDLQAKKEALLYLGHLHLLQQELDTANDYYRIALSLFEDQKTKATIRFHLGGIARRQEKRERAKLFFNAVATQTAYPEIRPLAQRLLNTCKRQEGEPVPKRAKR